MRYHARTEMSPEDVLQRARDFFDEHTKMELADEGEDSLAFRGRIGEAKVRVDRAHGYTNVHAETDREVGLDVTDVTKRFLYTIQRRETLT